MHRHSLPQLDRRLFLTDGGIETTLIFHEGLELPDFAAFDLLRRPSGQEALRKYFRPYAALAARYGTGLILESPTWRASPDWAARLGYPDVSWINREAIALLEEMRQADTVLSGCIGPRGDGYIADRKMTVGAARDYHRDQVGIFAGTTADMVSAITMNYAEEAIGIAQAARDAGMPVAISFTVETDGRLPSGQPLEDAIEAVDAATRSYPAYYMLNCAHPDHLRLQRNERIRGLRANASRKSHAELNESTALDAGDPAELGRQYAELKRTHLPNLTVMGGCCGTDHRHVDCIAAACLPLF